MKSVIHVILLLSCVSVVAVQPSIAKADYLNVPASDFENFDANRKIPTRKYCQRVLDQSGIRDAEP